MKVEMLYTLFCYIKMHNFLSYSDFIEGKDKYFRFICSSYIRGSQPPGHNLVLGRKGLVAESWHEPPTQTLVCPPGLVASTAGSHMQG